MIDVAVIMRTKNRPLLLHRALSSVLLQHYQNWRLYLVNDGGDRDALEEMLQVYRPVFGARLVVIHHETSKGMEAASNAGLARGEEAFIVIHDDDDSWHPDFLLRSVAFLSDPKRASFVAVTTRCTLITEVIEDGAVRLVGRGDWPHNIGIIDYTEMLKGNRFPPICMLFRRAAIQEIGPFNDQMPVLGDWDFNIRLMRVGDIGFVSEVLANYHHRVAGTNSVYSNTVVDGNALHEHQNRLFRNSLLRESLRAHPEFVGVLQAVMLEMEAQVSRLSGQQAQIIENQQRLSRLFGEMSRIISWPKRMLRPLRWLWWRLLPLRRVIARARGRI